VSARNFFAQRGATVMFAVALFFSAAAAHAADAEAGRQKAQTCVACHGPDGNSTTPGIPSLSGQPTQFIANALFMFRLGNRQNPPMAPFVEKLTNADLNDLAAYFSAQKPTAPAGKLDAQKTAAGERIAAQNHCTSCHGAKLQGQQHIPRLAGQQADYLRTQLTGFRASTRFDLDGQMTSAVQGLTPADIELLAEYLSGLGSP
jgi:cytochrome c553